MNKHISDLLINYVIYKDLYESKKYNNPYKILIEFIKFSLEQHGIQEFTINDIKMLLKEDYEFNLPVAVIQNSLKYIKHQQTNCNYRIKRKDLKLDDIIKEHSKNIQAHKELLLQLEEFGKNYYGLSKDEISELYQQFYNYMISNNYECKYSEIISSFIIRSKSDNAMITILDSIKKGVILYSGLTNQLEDLGFIEQKLILYLDTAVLFNLYGLNGENFKEITSDILNYRKSANKKELKLFLNILSIQKMKLINIFQLQNISLTMIFKQIQ